MGSKSKIIPWVILFSALLLWRPVQYNWQAIWVERWGILVLFFGLFSIWRLRFRSRLFPWALSYFLVLAVLGAYLGSYREGIDKDVIFLLRDASQQQITALLCFVLFLGMRSEISRYLKWIAWVVFGAVLLSPRTSPENPVAPTFLLFNASMAATFVVAASAVSPLSLVAALWARSWVAFLSFCVGMAYRYRRHRFTKVMGALLPLGLAGYLWHRPIPDSGRFAVTELFVRFWAHQKPYSLLFGVGPGTSRIWLPVLNLADARARGLNQADIFMWLHDDWIQTLGELGLVGFYFILACGGMLFRLAPEKDRPVVLAFFVAMAFNFPLHWALPALVGWSLVQRIAISRTEAGR